VKSACWQFDLLGIDYAFDRYRKQRYLPKGDKAMKRMINFFLVVLVALTLSACAAATNPVLDHGAPIEEGSASP
jgi:hypothetical protein